MRKVNALKVGVATIALGLIAYAAYAATDTETVNTPFESCVITNDVLTINGAPNYKWDGAAHGRYEGCQRVSLTPTAEQPFSSCYYIAGRRYCQ